MNQKKVKQIFKGLFESYSPATVREGSVVVDQIINPLTLLNDPLYQRIDELVYNSSLPTPLTSNEFLDMVGERYGIGRRIGNRATASIVLAMEEARTMRLPKGATFYTEDRREYETLQTYSFNESMFVQQSDGSFATPSITVRATSEGSDSAVQEGELRVPGAYISGLLYCTNPASSTTGTSTETNEEFYTRLRRAISSRAMDTPQGLLYKMGERFGSEARELVVIGANDDEMQRDVYPVHFRSREAPMDVKVNLSTDDPNDMIGGISSLMNDKEMSLQQFHIGMIVYDPRSNEYAPSYKALLNFVDEDELLRTINKINQQIKYGHFVFGIISKEAIAVYKRDLFEAIQPIFGITSWESLFDTSGDVDLDMTNEDYWFWCRRGNFSFIPREGFVTRGSQDTSLDLTVSLIEQFNTESSALTPITFAGKLRGQNTPKAHKVYRRTPVDKYASVTSTKTEVSQEDYNMVGKPDLKGPAVTTGIYLSDSFIRNAEVSKVVGTPTGGDVVEAWATAQHSSGIPDTATDGVRLVNGKLIFGPKQMDYGVISSMYASNAPSGSDMQAQNPVTTRPVVQTSCPDVDGFIMTGSFWTTTKATISGSLVSSGQLAISAYRNAGESALRWNDGLGITVRPLVVDNNGIVSPFDLSPNVVITDGGLTSNVNAIASARYAILPNTRYYYRLLYNTPAEDAESHSTRLSVWLWKEGDEAPAEPLVETGSYVPQVRRVNAAISKQYIGFGTTQLGLGEYWGIDDVTIRNINETYAQLLLELDISGHRGNLNLVLTARGKGDGGVGEGEPSFGHEVYVWDPTEFSGFLSDGTPVLGAWDLLDLPSYDSYSFFTHNIGIDNVNQYVTDGNRIYVMVTSTYPHQTTIEDTYISADVELDYLYGNSQFVSRKAYGKVDVHFVQPPDLSPNNEGYALYDPTIERTIVIEDIEELNLISPTGSYKNLDGNLTVTGGPIQRITNIYLLQSSGSGWTTDVPLREETEWRYFWQNLVTRGSMREGVVVSIAPQFVGTAIGVTCRIHHTVKQIDDYLQSDSRRKMDVDVLVKHKTVVLVDLVVWYKGPVASSLIEDIRRFIFEFPNLTLSATDLTDYLYDLGVNDIIIYNGENTRTALSLTARRIDYNGNLLLDQSFSSITRSRTEVFVPNELEVIRVSK